MEIQEIKGKLTLATVLHYYGLKTDKRLLLIVKNFTLRFLNFIKCSINKGYIIL